MAKTSNAVIRHKIVPLLFPILLMLSGCAPPGSGPGGPLPSIGGQFNAAPRSADDLLIVDCLLPGQVRMLGTMTYLTPRRPAKVTALECQIRGGEYVAYDQGDIQNALGIWLPKAEEGDKVAQTYVGEIYQRGMGGTSPRYDRAAKWYAMASAQGYDRAQINLGYLYEKGLGVPKDEVKALNLYRSATGLNQEISLESETLDAPEREELEDLRREVARQKEEVRSLRRQLEDARRKLRRTKDAYQWQQREIQAEREGLSRARADLARLKKDVPGDDSEAQKRLETLEKDLLKREKILAEQREESERLKQMVHRLEIESKEYQVQLADVKDVKNDESYEVQSLRREMALQREEVRSLRQQLEDSQRKLERTKEDYLLQKAEIQAEREALDRAYAALERLKNEPSGDDLAAQRRVEALEEELLKREGMLEKHRDESERLKQEVQRLDIESQKYQRQLADVKGVKDDEIQSLRLEVARQREEALSQQEELETLRTQLGRKEHELDRVQRDYTWRLEQIEAERKGLEQARIALEKHEMNSEAARAENRRMTQALADRQAALEAQEKEAVRLKGEVARLEAEAAQYQRQLSVYKEQLTDLPKPSIDIIKPEILTTRSKWVAVDNPAGDRVQLVGKVAAPAGLYSLDVNERLTPVDEGGLFETWIPLEQTSDTQIHVIAVDKQGKRTDVEFFVPEPESSGDPEKKIERKLFGRYYALIIGNNDYRSLPDLNTAVRDAEDVAAVLRERYGFSTEVMINASRFDIYKALDAYRVKLTEKDNFLLYYAGHGEMDKANNRGYWLPVDADPDSFVNSIPNYTITDILNNMSVKQGIIIADTCYSGILTRSVVSIEPSGMSWEKRYAWLVKIAGKQSRIVLSSGGLKPVLDAGTRGHSIFANALLDALEENRDILEASALYRKVRSKVLATSRKFGFEQTPQYAANLQAGHMAGDFLFVPLN